ncbi:MAG: Asp-tRNA(Asn)/Glu-tRNA(Gln) amidotransferase subunit GatC [Clostridia bacterium]|nr:Asp-tRNA(Asn)/Glu-tRNA(Gln) amidotransferase subunit GatC [Clostridia bacterium]
MAVVGREEIIRIAKLADLNLTDAEIDKYAEDLTDILEFAEIVNQLNTDEIKETVGINGEYNVFRKDEVKQTLSKEELLKNAPSQEEGMFRIPKVIQ